MALYRWDEACENVIEVPFTPGETYSLAVRIPNIRCLLLKKPDAILKAKELLHDYFGREIPSDYYDSDVLEFSEAQKDYGHDVEVAARYKSPIERVK
ncbi:hypothetical protein LCGC14_0864500 [marine sediment metagenome]|uniref:Uncharacterized protein n=1 Tax=marine sediment metagenome TaxID=412755 RepID=A0A0F9P6E1_9ZZZZ